MKNLKTIAIAILVTFSGVTATAQTRNVDVTKSAINWVGKKVTGKHEGTVNLREGSLIFKNKKLTGGSFIVDMTSLAATDLKVGEGKEKLEGHLKSDDFFGTDKFATSKLVFKTVKDNGKNSYAVTGDLTIKSTTNPITFTIIIKGNTATTNLKIDRTKFDVKYGSGSFFDNLGDKAISDNFDLNVALQF